MNVVNIRKKELQKCGIQDFQDWNKDPNNLYIGRNMSFYVPGTVESKWNNPYSTKKYPLGESLRLYEKHIRDTTELWNSLPELEGKNLGCWCDPAPCHGRVLMKLLNEYKAIQELNLEDINPEDLKYESETSGELEIIPSVYKTKNEDGDFSWMVNFKKHEDTLFLFNDNVNDHKTSKKGMGNAIMRIYNVYNKSLKKPRSAGISTGYASFKGGYTELNDDVKRIIDSEIEEIRQLIKKYGYKKVIWSSTDDKGSDLGTGLFKVNKDVRKYIVDKINSLKSPPPEVLEDLDLENIDLDELVYEPSPEYEPQEIGEHLRTVLENVMLDKKKIDKCIDKFSKLYNIPTQEGIKILDEMFRDVPAERLKLSRYTDKSVLVQVVGEYYELDARFLLNGLQLRHLRQGEFKGRGTVFRNRQLNDVRRYMLTRQYNQKPMNLFGKI